MKLDPQRPDSGATCNLRDADADNRRKDAVLVVRFTADIAEKVSNIGPEVEPESGFDSL